MKAATGRFVGLGALASTGIVLLVLLGVGLRIWVLGGALGAADSDEAVHGLMARHLDELPVFAWSTNYAGNFETLIIGLVFAVFGSSVLAMKLTVTALHLVAALLVWRIGRRLIDERAGVIAGLAFWIWPGVYVWWSTKARDYEVLLVCGLAVLLCATRLIQESEHRRDWLWFGLAAGVGWWTNPQIAYLAAPALAWILIANRRAVFSVPWAAPTFILGAFPWVFWNLRYDWGSLEPTFEATEGYLARLSRFWREGLPMAVGLREPYHLGWIFPAAPVAFVVAVAAGVASLLTRRKGAALLAVALVAYPLIHAVTPVSGYTGEGRYLYLFAPLLALLIGHAARTTALTLVAFTLAIAVSLGQLGTMGDDVSGIAFDRPVPKDMGSLVRSLEQERVDAVWTDYWIAYRLTLASREKVIAAAIVANRYPPYEQHVRRSPRSAWVYISGSAAEQRFTSTLTAKGVPYTTLRPGQWVVHVPARPVLPEELPAP